MNLTRVGSSTGLVNSVAGQELVIKNEASQNKFAWKQLSITARADCTITINEGTSAQSNLNLIADLSVQLENLNIYSLKFDQSGIQHYYIYGY